MEHRTPNDVEIKYWRKKSVTMHIYTARTPSIPVLSINPIFYFTKLLRSSPAISIRHKNQTLSNLHKIEWLQNMKYDMMKTIVTKPQNWHPGSVQKEPLHNISITQPEVFLLVQKPRTRKNNKTTPFVIEKKSPIQPPPSPNKWHTPRYIYFPNSWVMKRSSRLSAKYFFLPPRARNKSTTKSAPPLAQARARPTTHEREHHRRAV